MHSVKIKPKFTLKSNSKIGLVVLATDFMIEKDFTSLTKNIDVDLFVNRIHCYHPLNYKNLIKMGNAIPEIVEDILPGEKLDCVVYGCTSGTIAVGYEEIKKKINISKPDTEIVTPSSAVIKALKKLNIKKIAVFTPYSKDLNDDVVNFFKNENLLVQKNYYFDISKDTDIAKIDPNYLYEILKNIDLSDTEALFISCTNLPVLPIIDQLEKKLNKAVLSSNQVLIWDALDTIGCKNNIDGFGKLFNS